MTPLNFETKDVLSAIGQCLAAEAKAAYVKRKYPRNDFQKIMAAGEHLFFRAGVSRRVNKDESEQYVFLCLLREDLYLHCRSDKSHEELAWRLAECKCELEECLFGNISVPDKVAADSLNQLFSKTIQSYFPKQRSGAVNVYRTFCPCLDGMRVSIEDIRGERYKSLADIRKEIASKYREKGEQIS